MEIEEVSRQSLFPAIYRHGFREEFGGVILAEPRITEKHLEVFRSAKAKFDRYKIGSKDEYKRNFID